MARKVLEEVRKLNEKGQEVLDPTPMAPPVGYVKQPGMVELIRHQIRTELSRRADEVGMDSFEDADDFEVGDDYDPKSVHEMDEEDRLVTNREFAKKLFADLSTPKEEPKAPPSEILDKEITKS